MIECRLVHKKESRKTLFGNYLLKDGYYHFAFVSDLEKLTSSILQKPYPRTEIYESVCRLAEKAGCLTSNRKQLFEKIKDPSLCFVVTGHQPAVALGPAFILFKIASLLAITRWFRDQYPELNLLPLFWLAGEDHDIKEISEFRLGGQSRVIPFETLPNQKVGSIKPQPAADVLQDLISEKKLNPEQEALIQIFVNAYRQSPDLTSATARVIYSLWKEEECILLDGSDPLLKKHALELFQKEINQQLIFQTLEDFRAKNPDIDHAVHPRRYNFFLFEGEVRKRAVHPDEKKEGEFLRIINDKTALLRELQKTPEVFSPNVLMRTLYQQCLIPSVVYLAGPSEAEYWTQMIPVFTATGLTFPRIVKRPQFIYVEAYQEEYLANHKVDYQTLLTLSPDEIINRYLVFPEQGPEFDYFREEVEKQTEKLKSLFARSGTELSDFLMAERKKILNIIDNMEQKFRRSVRKRKEEQIQKMQRVYDHLFPGQMPNERHWSTLELLMKWNSRDLLSMHHLLSNEVFMNGNHEAYLFMVHHP